VTSSKRVFISYAREDEPAARRLRQDLSQRGVMPWRDVEDLLAGDDWEQAILDAIDASDYVLLLLSGSSVDKTGMVQKEVRHALDRALLRPPGARYVIPLRLSDCKPRHRSLAVLHYVDLFPDWAEGLSDLLRAMDITSASHVYVVDDQDARRAEFFPIGTPLPPRVNTVSIDCRSLPEIRADLVPSKRWEQGGGEHGILIKLWTVASVDWPRSVYRKEPWSELAGLLLDARSEEQKIRLAELATCLWALSREQRPYDEDDWRALRKLIQTPVYE
jgi:hypothetical protein